MVHKMMNHVMMLVTDKIMFVMIQALAETFVLMTEDFALTRMITMMLR